MFGLSIPNNIRTTVLLASSDFAGNGTPSFILEYQIIERGIVLVLFCITKQDINCVRQCLS